MSTVNLFRYIRHLRDNKQDTQRYEIAFWKKVVYPLTLFVMVALALPFAYLHARAGAVGVKVFGGIMLGLSFHLSNTLFSHVGLLHTWPPIVRAGARHALPDDCAVGAALGRSPLSHGSHRPSSCSARRARCALARAVRPAARAAAALRPDCAVRWRFSN
jgi:hypothetical protein